MRFVLTPKQYEGRDDPNTIFPSGIHDGFSEGSKKLMRDGWRDDT